MGEFLSYYADEQEAKWFKGTIDRTITEQQRILKLAQKKAICASENSEYDLGENKKKRGFQK